MISFLAILGLNLSALCLTALYAEEVPAPSQPIPASPIPPAPVNDWPTTLPDPAPQVFVPPVPKYNDRWLCKPGECEMGLGAVYLPYDAQYKPFVLETSGAYNFNNYISWEVYRFGWALGRYATGLRGQVYNDLHRQLDGVSGVDVNSIQVLGDNGMKNLRFYVGSNVQFRLFEVNVNMSQKLQFKHEWLATLGSTYFDMKSQSQVAIDIGVRMKSYIDEHWYVDVRFNQNLGVTDDRQRSIGLFGLGIGYKF